MLAALALVPDPMPIEEALTVESLTERVPFDEFHDEWRSWSDGGVYRFLNASTWRVGPRLKCRVDSAVASIGSRIGVPELESLILWIQCDI